MKRSRQLALPLPVRGGRRLGAGRKPRGPRAGVSHKARAGFDRPTPVHVTLRVRRHVWNLRSRRCFRRIENCFMAACGRFGVRLIEFSIQGNHVNLIVEADDSVSLSRALQGMAIRIAKALNDLMGRAGAVFSDHYHSRLLRTPTELVRAIRYVLSNNQHHYGASADADAFSSAALPEERKRLVLCIPVGWLLREGWKRAAPLSAGPSG